MIPATSAAYICSVMNNAPNAIHVYDHFHVVELIRKAIDKVRKETDSQEADLEKRKIIKGSRWVLLSKNKPLYKAYYLKEDLAELWKQSTKEEVENQLEYWCKNAVDSGLKLMIKATNSIRAYKSGTLAWYDYRTSNAKVEGIINIST